MFDESKIREHYLRTIHKVRNFLLSRSSKEFLTFLFFVFIAFCFWILQVLNDDYESDFSVKINLKNVPDNVVLTSEPPREMKVRLKDRGTVLVNYWLGNSLYPLSLDFNDYASTEALVVVPNDLLAQRIKSQLSQSTQLISLKPDTISFIYTKGEGKKVPVKLQGNVVTDPRYYISNITYQPDSVMVYAPGEILDTIRAAYTASTTFEQLSDTTTREVALQKVRGAKFIPDYSDITLMVDVYAEKTLEVPVHGINFPPDKMLRTFPSKVNVTFQVGLSHFKNVTADDFFIAVSYEELLHNKGSKCPLHLKAVPKIVNHPRISPTEVDFIIEQYDNVEDD